MSITEEFVGRGVAEAREQWLAKVTQGEDVSDRVAMVIDAPGLPLRRGVAVVWPVRQTAAYAVLPGPARDLIAKPAGDDEIAIMFAAGTEIVAVVVSALDERARAQGTGAGPS